MRKERHTKMFTVALSMIIKTENNLSIGEWLNKLSHSNKNGQ